MPSSTDVQQVLEILKQEYPNSKPSLDFRSPFELLVSTMLSAQTTDKAVNKVTPELFRKFPTANKLAKANLEDVKSIIKTIGLYNTKAKNLITMAKLVEQNFEGNIPNTMKELLVLPGVGRKTANVVLGNAFDIRVGITIDTHMIRIMNLLEWAVGKNAVKIEKKLMEFVPKEYWVNITHLFIDHGRAICIANRPRCSECQIEKFCPSSLVKT